MKDFHFEWCGGHAVTNFVNTLDERLSLAPKELLLNYDALIDFARQANLIARSTATRLTQSVAKPDAVRVLSRAVRLREALFALLVAITSNENAGEKDLSSVESEIHVAESARGLALSEDRITWLWQQPDAAERPLWELALAAGSLLTFSYTRRRIKKCAADDCGVIFVDDSRASSRRWCSMSVCGNRNKVRQFRIAHKGSGRVIHERN